MYLTASIEKNNENIIGKIAFVVHKTYLGCHMSHGVPFLVYWLNFLKSYLLVCTLTGSNQFHNGLLRELL